MRRIDPAFVVSRGPAARADEVRSAADLTAASRVTYVRRRRRPAGGIPLTARRRALRQRSTPALAFRRAAARRTCPHPLRAEGTSRRARPSARGAARDRARYHGGRVRGSCVPAASAPRTASSTRGPVLAAEQQHVDDLPRRLRAPDALLDRRPERVEAVRPGAPLARLGERQRTRQPARLEREQLEVVLPDREPLARVIAPNLLELLQPRRSFRGLSPRRSTEHPANGSHRTEVGPAQASTVGHFRRLHPAARRRGASAPREVLAWPLRSRTRRTSLTSARVAAGGSPVRRRRRTPPGDAPPAPSTASVRAGKAPAVVWGAGGGRRRRRWRGRSACGC